MRAAALTSRRALIATAFAAAGCATAAGATAGRAFPPIPIPGPLRSLGGFEIDTGRLGAGNLSGIHLGRDLTVTMVDDRGRWAQARVVLDGAGHAAGLEPLGAGPLRDGAGRPLPRGRGSDAEAICRLPDGTWLIAFERWHRIRAFRRLDGPGGYFEAPPGLDRAPANGGLESLAVLADGRLLALAEDLAAEGVPGGTRGWIGRPGRWVPIAWQPTPGYYATDAAGLPDGGALVLERRFSLLGGFSARLRRVGADAIAGLPAGGILAGEEILRLNGIYLPAENWEGVSAVRVDGRVLVAMVTDSNDSVWQRSLMLLFELPG